MSMKKKTLAVTLFSLGLLAILATPVQATSPWSGMQTEIRGGIMSFVTDFLVPIVALVMIILGLVQIPGVVAEHHNGHGNEFWKKVFLAAGCIVLGIGFGALWGILQASI